MLNTYYDKLTAEMDEKRQEQKNTGRVWDEVTTEYMGMDAEARKASQLEDMKLMIEEIKHDSDEEDEDLKAQMNAINQEDEEELEKLLE